MLSRAADDVAIATSPGASLAGRSCTIIGSSALTAEVPPDALYREGPNSQEFPRTASRLAEMQTHDYMALAHAAGPAAVT
jgi:hypothetical protein